MKKAFTMLELIFVIVLVGILSYFATSGFSRNSLREAADQVISHIRYTQHLAMMDDKFNDDRSWTGDSKGAWFASNWQIWFRIFDGSYYYEVFSDRNRGNNSDAIEEAIDPLTGKGMGNGGIGLGLPENKDFDLSKKFGITNLTFTSNCLLGNGGKISFDSLGRPYGNVSYVANDRFWKYLNDDCNITLGNSEGNVTITITKETGYTYISSQNY